MFASELAGIGEWLNATLARLAAPELAGEARSEAAASYSEELHRLGAAAEAVGLTALARVIERCCARAPAADADEPPPAQVALLSELPHRVQTYLASPTDPAAANGLLDLLAAEAWPVPLSERERLALAADLVAVELVAPVVEARAG
jgi:hypothetical protein